MAEASEHPARNSLFNFKKLRTTSLRRVLSNFFDTMGHIRINLEAAGHNSKQRLKFIDRYKLHMNVLQGHPSLLPLSSILLLLLSLSIIHPC